MRTVRNLARTTGFFSLAAGVILGISSCGREPVSARAQPPKVTKWKHHPQHERGIPKGIVVEQHGGEIRARYCDLRPGSGFVIDSVHSQGTYLADRGVIVFPLGMHEAATAEQWVQAGGPHLSVAFDAKAARLTGDLASTGERQSYHFVRHGE